MKLKTRKIKFLHMIFTIMIGFILFTVWENNIISITKYEYRNAKIPKSFNGTKIVHISDLHNREFHGKLLKKLNKINPDFIVLTGDLIDRRKTNINIAVEAVKDFMKVAPVYYVSGNHEQLSGYYRILVSKLRQLNVTILDNDYKIISKNGEKIGIVGLADPAIRQNEETYLWDNSYEYLLNKYINISHNINTDFNILLSHRPEKLHAYDKMDVDLVFSGHAHGGQVRIPFVGGIVAPNQGFFPKYTKGMYVMGTTTMVVSTGLGNSIVPVRVLNPPEIVVVTLR
jgi:predicted MPP superfamily phosphohydrolase